MNDFLCDFCHHGCSHSEKILMGPLWSTGHGFLAVSGCHIYKLVFFFSGGCPMLLRSYMLLDPPWSTTMLPNFHDQPFSSVKLAMVKVAEAKQKSPPTCQMTTLTVLSAYMREIHYQDSRPQSLSWRTNIFTKHHGIVFVFRTLGYLVLVPKSLVLLVHHGFPCFHLNIPFAFNTELQHIPVTKVSKTKVLVPLAFYHSYTLDVLAIFKPRTLLSFWLYHICSSWRFPAWNVCTMSLLPWTFWPSESHMPCSGAFREWLRWLRLGFGGIWIGLEKL